MPDSRDYSVTSNEVKLFKHLDRLQLIQQGRAAPTQLHLSPTNRCNINCVYCCFDERDRKLELDIRLIRKAVWDFRQLGLKSCEITGGGDPTLYSHINELVDYIHGLGVRLGMNTNAIEIQNIHWPDKFDWIRVAANVIDIPNRRVVDRWKDNVRWLLTTGCRVTSCYIVSNSIGLKHLDEVVDFMDGLEIPTRIAPDCIQSKDGIRALLDRINAYVADRKPRFCFSSDFNVYLGSRTDDVCMMHMLKPYLFTDGWVYACPSSELAVENGKNMNPKFRICRAEDIYDYYAARFDVNHFSCSYCKYAAQNEILRSLLVGTEFNDFV